MADIRWKQRLQNYQAALKTLKEAVELADERELTNLEKQGLIQSFKFVHELAWNLLKDFLTEKGSGNIFGSRDATRAAFKYGLIEDGEAWMKMIDDRNLTTHTYNKEIAESIFDHIMESFSPAFNVLEEKFTNLAKE